MVTVHKDVISTLNSLIEICRDGERGFRMAAEKGRGGRLSDVFREYSEQRAEFIDALRRQVERLGGRPEDSGTAAGAAHRAWSSARAAASGDSGPSVVAECERGEDAAVRAYREALKADLPADVRMLVERQYEKVKEAHDRMRTLELEDRNLKDSDVGDATEGAPD